MERLGPWVALPRPWRVQGNPYRPQPTCAGSRPPPLFWVAGLRRRLPSSQRCAPPAAPTRLRAPTCFCSRLISLSPSGCAPPSHGTHFLFFRPTISAMASGGLHAVRVRTLLSTSGFRKGNWWRCHQHVASCQLYSPTRLHAICRPPGCLQAHAPQLDERMAAACTPHLMMCSVL